MQTETTEGAPLTGGPVDRSVRPKPIAHLYTVKNTYIGPTLSEFAAVDYVERPGDVVLKKVPLYVLPDDWIAISDRTPPDGVEVLTYPGWAAGNSGVCIDMWCAQHKSFLMGIEDGDRVTHWMPIPATPNLELTGGAHADQDKRPA